MPVYIVRQDKISTKAAPMLSGDSDQASGP